MRVASATAALVAVICVGPSAQAHLLTCEKRIEGSRIHELSDYPAVLEYELVVKNVHPTDASDVLGFDDALLREEAGFAPIRALPFQLGLGATHSESADLSIASYEDCLRLAAADGTIDNYIDNVLVVEWDLGEAQCRAQIVCVPENDCTETRVAEVCNGLDDDCDGQVDEEFDSMPTTCGVGACAGTGVTSCVNGIVEDSCAIGTAVAETCNAQDDDCDGSTDEDLGTRDCGSGTCATTVPACVNGVEQTCTPGQPALEVCDGLDNDCDGAIDEELETACYDGPAGTENVGVCQASLILCVESALTACTGQVLPSSETCNGLDDDCDGETDELGTESCGVGECAATVNRCENGQPVSCVPGAPTSELCNGLDDDCDGAFDDEPIDAGQACATGQLGVCAAGTTSCTRTVLDCRPNSVSSEEVCNGLDDDCDGETDEGLGTVTCGVGSCAATVSACVNGFPLICVPGAPGIETCNGADDDCDGATDESDPLAGAACDSGLEGVCEAGARACVSGALQCTPSQSPGTESCNQLDDDCDGTVDDGVAIQHSNGLGQNFSNCLPLGTPGNAATYSEQLAIDAANSASFAGVVSTGQVCGTSTCVRLTGVSTCATWCYTGTLAGRVRQQNSCNCPSAAASSSDWF